MAAFRGTLTALLVCVCAWAPSVLGQAQPVIGFEGKVIPFSSHSTVTVNGGLPPFTITLAFQPPYGQPAAVATIASFTGAFSLDFVPANLSPPPTPSSNGFTISVTDVTGITLTTGLFGIAPAAAGGNGDPLFVDWNGEAYEFIGEDNATFNLLSTFDHNLNVHLVGANLSSKPDGGTLMDAFGLTLNNNTVEVSIDEAGDVTVILDGSVVITREDLNKTVDHTIEVDLGEDAMIQVELFREYHGHCVQIFTPIIHLVICPTMPGIDLYYAEYLRAHLNFDLHLRDPTISGIHGIIGQTAPNSRVNTKRSKLLASATGAAGTSTARFTGQGTEDWYKTTALFAHDNKLNHFGKEVPPVAAPAGESGTDALWRQFLRVHSADAGPGPELEVELQEAEQLQPMRRRLLALDDNSSTVYTASGRQHS